MAVVEGAPPADGAPHPHHMARRRIAIPVATTAAGAKVISGSGRVAGWSLFDTQGLGSVPAVGNVLDGFTAAAGAVFTVPANTAWYGTIGASCSAAVAPAGATKTVNVSVSTAVGLTPSAATLIQLDERVGAVGATGTNSNVGGGTDVWGPGWIINSTAGGLAVSMATTADVADAWASGVTLPFPGGIAGTVVELYDGQDATGVLMAVLEFPAGTSVVEALGDDGPDFGGGVFLNVISGSVRGSIWVLAEPGY